ncbi:MAG TPA: manganese efflux pump MntP family protein [Candidatus Faecalibacterium faecipullorum]|uniref:Putative manganese efflux pump MntP n=1 Tax=Candidatus Faecalibacterium faecipullorum TaxID=2838578 RepID=A0A9D2MFP6_9FIRM|nr:manganese efflux pump MntP family protein [Candidatus Faecalibacterium faecipullorum]
MEWSIGFFVNSLLLGVGLAMDAFSVSMANGLNEPGMSRRRMGAIAGVFAAFQALMPLAGWVCVHTVLQLFEWFTVLIPWIALILLAYIGGKMLLEGIRHKEGEEAAAVSGGGLLLQGVATSIDALSVGFTIAEYGPVMAVVCALLIAAVTFVICTAGLVIGRKFGTRLAGRASILGGAILIFIGVEIFVSSL